MHIHIHHPHTCTHHIHQIVQQKSSNIAITKISIVSIKPTYNLITTTLTTKYNMARHHCHFIHPVGQKKIYI